MIQLGQVARDTITGFEGVVVARTEWLFGCVRISLQPKTLKDDGSLKDSVTFDEPQCIVVEEGTARTARAPAVTTGGPQPEPRRHPDPERR